jgi:DNA polymerase III sliding clamp (beta) subunit (PCNA family)
MKLKERFINEDLKQSRQETEKLTAENKQLKEELKRVARLVKRSK